MSLYAQTARCKLSLVLSHVLALLARGVKFLLFAHHLSVLDGVQRALALRHVRVVRIDGATNAATRTALVAEFQCSSDCRVALLSLTAASTGLTLTSACHVVMAELHWTPALLLQAEDRVHRIGQKLPVRAKRGG